MDSRVTGVFLVRRMGEPGLDQSATRVEQGGRHLVDATMAARDDEHVAGLEVGVPRLLMSAQSPELAAMPR